MPTNLKKAAEAIRRASKVVLASHHNPDGDTLGSSLAIVHALRKLGKQAVPLSTDGVPEIYRWLPGHEWIQAETDARDFDLAIVCDTGSVDRIGRARPAVEAAPVSLNIDHHVTEGTFGQIRVVDATAAATGEIVFALLRELGVEMDRAMAECLLCAIITDTGSFRFLNVTPNTFRIAGALMRLGACPAAIGERVFDNRSYASIKLLGRALDSLKLSPDGRVSWGHLRVEDFEELEASDEETEGIVNHVHAVRDAKIGILFREVPGKKVRISLRARAGYDVNSIAQAFGGGGHTLAAGCTVDPPLEAAERKVLDEVFRQLS